MPELPDGNEAGKARAFESGPVERVRHRFGQSGAPAVRVDRVHVCVPNALRSEHPLATFGETILFGLLFLVPLVVITLAIHRLKSAASSGTSHLHGRRAALISVGVGALLEAALNASSGAPLSTFVSNIVFVLWAALLVGLGILAVEHHRSRNSVAR